MKTNVNRNSVRVLKTTKKDCFCHTNIPNLVIGDKHSFTIQLGLLLTNDTDAVLYAQVDGFSIEIINRHLKFFMKGFCELEAPKKYELSPQQAYDITIRYWNNTLTMFLDGKQIAKNKVTQKANVCTGYYVIGKNFTGGITFVRVLSKALPDDEISKQIGYQPLPDNDCVFQTDCSTIQYKDISKNRLAIWTESTGACCDLMTRCAVLDGKGCYQCNVAASAQTTGTVLIKLWPLPEQRRQTIYTALNANGIYYSLDLIPQSNYSFQLCLSGCGKEICLPKKLLPQLWQDIALVFLGDYVRIYLDGVFQAKYSFTYQHNRISIVVGAENQTHEVAFKKGYAGYLAYTAEFSRSLTANEVLAFCKEPPYEFEPGLSAYLKLDEAEVMELISKSPVTVKGSAGFQFVNRTTPFETTLWFPTKSKHFIWTTDPSENRSGNTNGVLGIDALLHRISPSMFKQWMNKLDKAYDSYKELVGGVPSDGDKIRLVPGDPKIPAFYVSDSPRCPYIFMHVDSLPSIMDSIRNTQGADISFAVVHELGHLFDIGDWTFHGEFFANTKMYYMLDDTGFKVNLAGLQGGEERMESLYKEQLVAFNKDKAHYKIFDAPAAEPPLLVFYPALLSLGSWKESWKVLKQVFRSYLVTESETPNSYTGEHYRAKGFFDRIGDIGGTDITKLFPDGLKQELSNRYFNDISSREVPYIRYNGPDSTVSDGLGALVLKFMESAQPIVGSKLFISLCKKYYRYPHNTPTPVRVGPEIVRFECSLTNKDIPQKQTDMWLLAIPFSRFEGLKEILSNGIMGRDTLAAAAQVVVDSGAFTYEDGILTHQRIWKEPFFRKIFSAPIIDEIFPQYGAVNIAENGMISVSFPRNMDKKTGVVSLNNNIGILEGEWDAEGLTYMALYSELLKDKVYTVLFSGFKDLDGNLTSDLRSKFTRDNCFPYATERINIYNLLESVIKENWNFDGTTLTINSGANVTLCGSVDNGRRVVVAPDATNVRITLDDLSIKGNHPMIVSNAEVTLILAQDSDNVLTATKENSAGILTNSAHLVIEGTGNLIVKGGDWRPAIGGIKSNITINNGNITATGGINAAGIGGKAKEGTDDGSGGIITINGGTVTATGGDAAAGIGGGRGGDGGEITIIGGIIHAQSQKAAAIGGGVDGESGVVIIRGGYIVAKSNEAPGIGVGSSGVKKCNITIQGGTIYADSYSAPAIGCWEGTDSVIITGGSVKSSNVVKPLPKNKKGIAVYNNILNFPISEKENLYITSGHFGDIIFNPIQPSSKDTEEMYSIYNVKLDENKKVGLWLPEGSKPEIIELVVKGITYSAEYRRLKEQTENTLSVKGTVR
ncbi:MAG: carbohydrate-binding domain-containing protein [Anaerovoracaceae bacterium]